MAPGAARYSRDRVLGTPWPRAAPAHDAQAPDLVVDSEAAARPPHRFRSLQHAVDQAIRELATYGPGRRRRILVRPGFHAGPVLIPRCAPPLSVLGLGADHATLAAAIDAGMPGHDYAARFGGGELWDDLYRSVIDWNTR